MKYTLACLAITHLSKYLGGVLFCGVTKWYLPLAKNNLQLLIACHGINYAVRQEDHECIYTLQALPYAVDAVILLSLVSLCTNKICTAEDKSRGVDFLAPADPKLALNKTARTEM